MEMHIPTEQSDGQARRQTMSIKPVKRDGDDSCKQELNVKQLA